MFHWPYEFNAAIFLTWTAILFHLTHLLLFFSDSIKAFFKIFLISIWFLLNIVPLNYSCENLVHGIFGVNSFHIHIYYLLNDHVQALVAYRLLEPSQVHLILGLGWKSVHKHSYKLPLIAKIFNFTAKFSLKLLEFVESTPVSLGFRSS